MESYRCLSFFFLLVSGSFIASSLAYTFKVGGQDGWVLHPSENYTSWAGRNRFLVNDTLYFKYKEGADYVLQVSKDAYDQCNVHHSWRQMRSGNSFFTFDKSGPFYFIGGKKDNCDQGQKLHVIVLSTGHKTPVSPSPAASPVPSVSPAASPAPVSHVPASAPSPHVAPLTSPAPVSHVPAPSTHVDPAITPSPASHVPPSAPSIHASPAPASASNVPAPTPKSPEISPAPETDVPSPHSVPSPHPKSPSPSSSPASPPAPKSPSSPPATPPSQPTPPVSSPSSSEFPSDSSAPAPAPKSAASPIGQSNIFVPTVALVLSLIYAINVV